jgi:hypothetical protein
MRTRLDEVVVLRCVQAYQPPGTINGDCTSQQWRFWHEPSKHKEATASPVTAPLPPHGSHLAARDDGADLQARVSLLIDPRPRVRVQSWVAEC